MKRTCFSKVLLLFLVFHVVSFTSCRKKTKKVSSSNGEEMSKTCSRCFSRQRCKKGRCFGLGMMNVKELKKLLPKKNFKLINALDFKAGHIPGTDAQIPYNNVEKLTEFLGPDKHQLVVLYCRSVPKARMASRRLLEKGYTNIVVVSGGLRAWKKAGYPIK